VTLQSGVYLLGGWGGAGTSSFLPTGSSEWEEGPSGPALEVGYACAVQLGPDQFLQTGGLGKMNQVVEFDAESSSWSQWPSLGQQRWGHSCAVLGNDLVLAGGWDENSKILDTTSILSLTDKSERQGGPLIKPRAAFSIQILRGRPLAFGGLDSDAVTSSEGLDSVEMWNPKEESWEEVEGLESRRAGFAGTVVTLPC